LYFGLINHIVSFVCFSFLFFSGATGLDKKSKKQFDAAVLEGLGAKKAKAVKVPAKMAIGIYWNSYINI
jgi:Domain of unknown function (DUF4602)